MEDNLMPAPAPEPISGDDLKKLRMLVHASAISLLILTGTVFVFLYRQVSTLQNNTRELVNYIVEYENSNASEFIAEAHRKFAEFQQAHPDFAPVYARYFGTNPPPARPAPANAEPEAKVIPSPAR
jgi:hypothetical protein